MTAHGTAEPSPELREVAQRRPHLRDHLRKFKQITGEFPMLVEEPDDEHANDRPNVLYSVGGPIYCHVYGDLGRDTKYYAIEPTLSSQEGVVYEQVRNALLERSIHKTPPDSESEYDDRIEELLRESTHVSDEDGLLDRLRTKLLPGRIEVARETYENIRYRLNRDIVGFGPLEPVMRDPQNEDIHVIGPHEVYVDHGTFGMLDTTVDFGTAEQFDNWLRNMGERMGDPVSDSEPIVDSTLPDGSRINIIYSDDVSLKGPSLTIRQGDETPLTVPQITKWGTLSPRLAAYLWLCLENEQTVFVVGETASGKTTTLNAITTFIPRDAKIYSAEDTSEVLPPHDTWQQLLTREGGGEQSSDVDLFDLVAAALRSRPEYIIVGEVRGEEGRMAFQAAQTGHPVMLTFHASDIVSMIQRFTGEPIDIPETFMDNADVALFQNRVKQGDDVLRRVTSVHEIEGYSDEMEGVVTREVFNWDPVEDEIVFQGMNNSYV
ncbi:MAG: type II/IV secretion system ATPase subunit, partial [Haloplanus sp.]